MTNLLETLTNSLNDKYHVYATGKSFKVRIVQDDGLTLEKRFASSTALEKFLVKRNLRD